MPEIRQKFYDPDKDKSYTKAKAAKRRINAGNMKKCTAIRFHMIHHSGMRSCFTLRNFMTELAYPRLKYGLKRCDFNFQVQLTEGRNKIDTF